jgi:asparagine synthase (glutamine-hydrolysing)
MCNEDGSIRIIFNGEIYNFEELRAGLLRAGHVFASRSDTEVIVHLYEERGDACVEALDGMFAFALWDAKHRRLLLARDRVGKKPLKYAELGGSLLFASELKALLASGLVERSVDAGALHDFLSFGHVPTPGTGFAAIRKLPPGHFMVWEAGKLRLERYWSLDYRAKVEASPEAWRLRVRDAVERAVRRRLISDVPLGAFLSGGIDSSIVVACMAEASSRPVETFSIGFEEQTHDELPYARLIAERYRTAHHEFVVRAESFDLLPVLARLYEEPYADSSALPSYLLARETRRHVTVALNGDGGDEGFGGYLRYRDFPRWRRRARRLRPFLAALARLAEGCERIAPRASRSLAAAHGMGDADLGNAYAWAIRFFTDREKGRFYREELRRELVRPSSARLARWMQDPRAGEALLDRMAFTDVMGYLPDDLLVKMDLATMAHGLEARSPLLDHHVLELAASAPAAVRCPDGRLKGLLVDAFRDALPPALWSRPKQGFALPIQDWFRGAWAGPARDLLLAPDTRLRAYFETSMLRRAIDEHVSGRIARGYQLWALLALELWHRDVVERPVGAG